MWRSSSSMAVAVLTPSRLGRVGVGRASLTERPCALDRQEPAPLERRLGGAVALALQRHRRGAREPVPRAAARDVAGAGRECRLGEVEEGGADMV